MVRRPLSTPPPQWDVRLEATPPNFFTWQALAGLALLRDRGDIALELRPPVGRGAARSQLVRMQIVDRVSGSSASVELDLRDGATLDGNWDGEPVDVVFKRTLTGEPTTPPVSSTVLPYGLVFECRSEREGLLLRHSMRSIQGLLPPRSKLDMKLIAWALRVNGRLMASPWWKSKYLPVSLAQYEIPPDQPAEDLILYQTRLWDPASGGDERDRQSKNESRAETVRALRRAFGDRFVGGLVPSPFASAVYPDCLSPLSPTRESYLRLVHRCSVVVSTAGLHGSVPFKLPEYLAASRAVVTETIDSLLPKPLEDQHHVAVFSTPDQCVANCERLLTDPGFRNHLRHSAAQYYRTEVRPEALLKNRLEDLRRM